jgi:hypothetical protein
MGETRAIEDVQRLARFRAKRYGDFDLASAEAETDRVLLAGSVRRTRE